MCDDSRLDALLDRYEDAIENGECVDIKELCKDAPDLADELRARVEMLGQMNGYFSGVMVLDRHQEGETLRVNGELTSLKFHAKGGLGAVYRACESSIKRDVAVKFIHRNLAADPDSRNRFALEAEVTGRLEHPGVVPLYGIGEAGNGRMFYYMRFIDGQTMDDAIRRFHQNHTSRSRFAEQSVEFRRLLTSFVSACKTVAYAHNRGIVHRDLKPANIMLGKYGETLVVDWGLAVPVSRDPRFAIIDENSLRPEAAGNGTASGSGAGTAAYMSPEQASGLLPAPASDIYSLGATLYKILTGEPSVSGEHITEVKQQIVTGNILRPSARLVSVPCALEAICLHAMALQPHNRYPTALDLAEDIEHYLADADVTAYEEPWGRKLIRIARKHQAAIQTATVGLIALLVVTVGFTIWLASLASAEKQAREEADGHRREAEQTRDTVEEARQDNLKTSAVFLAESIAHQIDQRWRVMESARSSPELIRCLTALNSNPDDLDSREDLQSWLRKCEESRGGAFKQKSIWVVYGRDGTLQARVPANRVIGESFSHRDYFHGFGRDFQPDDDALRGQPVKQVTPHQFLLAKLPEEQHLHSAHVSDVFHSTATNHLQVTFTVPVWDRAAEELDKETIGVMAISLELQNLELPENAMLVQLRPDQISGQPGMVISHRYLQPHTASDLPPRIDRTIIEVAQQLERDRIQGGVTSAPLIKEYIDPVVKSNTGEEVTSIAAFAPVLIHSRPKNIRDVGWLVIVKEPGQQSATGLEPD